MELFIILLSKRTNMFTTGHVSGAVIVESAHARRPETCPSGMLSQFWWTLNSQQWMDEVYETSSKSAADCGGAGACGGGACSSGRSGGASCGGGAGCGGACLGGGCGGGRWSTPVSCCTTTSITNLQNEFPQHRSLALPRCPKPWTSITDFQDEFQPHSTQAFFTKFFRFLFLRSHSRRAEEIMFHKYHTFFHKVIVWRNVSQCSEGSIDFSTRGRCLEERFSMFHEFHTFLHGLLENGIPMFQPKCYWLRFWSSSNRRRKD